MYISVAIWAQDPIATPISHAAQKVRCSCPKVLAYAVGNMGTLQGEKDAMPGMRWPNRK